MIYHNVLSTLLCLAKVWHKMSNVVGRTTLSTTVMADIQPMSLPMQFHHTEHPPQCIAWFMRGSSLCSSVCDSWYLPVYSVLWHCQLHNSNGIQHLNMATLTHLMLSCSLSLTLTHRMYLECCYASVGTSYGPVSVCLSQVGSFIKMAEWIEQVFGKDASFHLSYTVKRNSGISKNNICTSLCNFIPNSGLRKFCFSILTIKTCYQLSSTRWALKYTVVGLLRWQYYELR